MAEPQLVVGLGNPGPQYATTRHNMGFLVADILADRIGSGFKVHKKSGAEVVTGRLAGRAVVLAKPRCYMNESGGKSRRWPSSIRWRLRTSSSSTMSSISTSDASG